MGHTFANILLHVVFSTKDRRPLIKPDIQPRLYEYMAGVARNEFGKAIKIGGVEDHIHGLLSVYTRISVGDMMAKWKSLSSGWVKSNFPEAADFAWQNGYSVFSVSQSNMAQVVRYIENQAEHHQRLSFKDELIALLERHGIDYDPDTIWS